jgi:hypothetical protein
MTTSPPHPPPAPPPQHLPLLLISRHNPRSRESPSLQVLHMPLKLLFTYISLLCSCFPATFSRSRESMTYKSSTSSPSSSSPTSSSPSSPFPPPKCSSPSLFPPSELFPPSVCSPPYASSLSPAVSSSLRPFFLFLYFEGCSVCVCVCVCIRVFRHPHAPSFFSCTLKAVVRVCVCIRVCT